MKKYYIAIVILTLIATSYLRLSDLNWMSFTTDEIAIVRASQEYLRGNIFNNFYGFDNPPLMKYFFTISFAIFGASEIFLRAVTAIFGLLTCILSYAFVKKFYKSNSMAVLVLILTSFSIIHVEYSRMALDIAALGFFFLLAVYLFSDKIVNNKWNSILLGIALGLGMASKYMMLYLILAIVLYSVAKKYIEIKLSPRIAVFIERGLLKAILISILVFFVVFPQSLYPMETNLNITVQNRSKEITTALPALLLSMGNVGSSAVSGSASGLLSIPFAYFLFFIIKENILFILFFIISLFTIYKKPKELDKFLFFMIIIFMLLLWFQKWGYESRYLMVIIPIMSVISSRFVLFLKEKTATIVIILSFILFFSFALMIHPYYDLYNNSMNNIFNLPKNYHTEGFKEGMAYIEENCNTLYTREGYADVMYSYMNKTEIILKPEMPACVMTESKDKDYVTEFVRTHDCEMKRQITIRGIRMIDIFYCKS